MSAADPLEDIYLSAGDVAILFKVSPKSISRWSHDGKLPVDSKTLVGAHRRYQARAILNLLADLEPNQAVSDKDFIDWFSRRHPTWRPRGRR